MKTYLFFVILILGFFSAVTAAVKPDVFAQKYKEVEAKIERAQAEKKAMTWSAAKTADRAAWMLKQPLPANCASPKSAIRELECRNIVQLHAQAFEQAWVQKVNKGWKPYGTEE
jgi:hypothetical protein